jgi:hypothetical protein
MPYAPKWGQQEIERVLSWYIETVDVMAMLCAWNILVLSQEALEAAVRAERFNMLDPYNMAYIKDQLYLNLEAYSYAYITVVEHPAQN